MTEVRGYMRFYHVMGGTSLTPYGCLLYKCSLNITTIDLIVLPSYL